MIPEEREALGAIITLIRAVSIVGDRILTNNLLGANLWAQGLTEKANEVEVLVKKAGEKSLKRR